MTTKPFPESVPLSKAKLELGYSTTVSSYDSIIRANKLKVTHLVRAGRGYTYYVSKKSLDAAIARRRQELEAGQHGHRRRLDDDLFPDYEESVREEAKREVGSPPVSDTLVMLIVRVAELVQAQSARTEDVARKVDALIDMWALPTDKEKS